jgi:hypothetical protein
MLDGLATDRMKLALKVLDTSYDSTVKVTDAEIETLKKSYLAGDADGLTLEEIAIAVIHEELDRLKTAGHQKEIG